MPKFLILVESDAKTAKVVADELNAHIDASQGNRDEWDDGKPFKTLDLSVFSPHQRLALLAALSYASSNADDVNEAFADEDGKPLVRGVKGKDEFGGADFAELLRLIDPQE